MAAPRLSDEQKTLLVERYRAGGTAAELASEFGCSAVTVTRVVKAALDPEDYEQLKQGRGRAPQKAAEETVLAAEAVLAIDDADDFGVDSDDTGLGDDDSFVPVPVLPLTQEQVECRPLEQASLPASAYMLVDKLVELEARPLGELPELGQLPPGEEAQRALVVYANPRQAKQLCGRSQRVIKLPDPWVLHRTARYLVAQGITRVVLEGSVYSLPGS